MNVLRAFEHLVNHAVRDLGAVYKGKNRANSMGYVLEQYVLDLFSHAFDLDEASRTLAHQQTFAFLGNANHPPDAILHQGDAIEIKKIENINADLALNSSHPKAYLFRDGALITQACRECDGGNWVKKDMLYIVGVVPKSKNELKGLWFIYGDCFVADAEIYTRISQVIAESIEQSGLELGETKELARVNRVDPLGISKLRVRGMWHIENPKKIFKYLNLPTDRDFFAHVIMKREKFDSFDQEDRNRIRALVQQNKCLLNDVFIKNPNNPIQNIDAVLLSL